LSANFRLLKPAAIDAVVACVFREIDALAATTIGFKER
jgi:hypothetical protein